MFHGKCRNKNDFPLLCPEIQTKKRLLFSNLPSFIAARKDYLKRMMKTLMITALLVTFALPAMAQRDDHAPEYSGPRARIDGNLDRLRAQNELTRQSVQQRREILKLRSNDTNVDSQMQQRSLKAQGEMIRRQEELRRTIDNYYNE